MKILMNVQFFHRYVEMVERKLFILKIISYLFLFLIRCVNEIGSYRCYCPSGWIGSTCAKAD